MKIGNGGTFDEEVTNFLNVDLDILSRSRLEPLVAAFGKNVSVHYVGAEGSRYGAHLSLYFPGKCRQSYKIALSAREQASSASKAPLEQCTYEGF